MIAELEIQAEARKSGGYDYVHIGIFEGHKVDWYIDMSDIRRVSKIFLSKAKTGRNIGGQFLKKWKTDEKRFDDFVSQFPTDRLSKYELSYLGACIIN